VETVFFEDSFLGLNTMNATIAKRAIPDNPIARLIMV
jgi:hypothetical protein